MQWNSLYTLDKIAFAHLTSVQPSFWKAFVKLENNIEFNASTFPLLGGSYLLRKPICY
ncbi:MAG: hypothetical protein QXT77_01475 [Candidatus Methanomethylicaceae archaeon]